MGFACPKGSMSPCYDDHSRCDCGLLAVPDPSQTEAQRQWSERAAALLERIEWGRGARDHHECPFCRGRRYPPHGNGHAPDCELAALLWEAGG